MLYDCTLMEKKKLSRAGGNTPPSPHGHAPVADCIYGHSSFTFTGKVFCVW